MIIVLLSSGDWSVDFHPACEVWADGLGRADAEALLAAVRVLRDIGPPLARPLVDTVKASRHANMKELRPVSTGRTESRVLFAFDKERRAILLVGGDKSGDWDRWYKRHIPIADDRLDGHQVRIEQRRTKAGATQLRKRSRKGKRR